MRSKPEILKEATSGDGCAYYDGSVYDGEVGSIEEAMDEYAKEVAIEYAHWLLTKLAIVPKDEKPESSAEVLYNQFLQQLKQS